MGSPTATRFMLDPMSRKIHENKIKISYQERIQTLNRETYLLATPTGRARGLNTELVSTGTNTLHSPANYQH